MFIQVTAWAGLTLPLYGAYERWGSAGTSVRGPKNHGRGHESLKGPIDIFGGYFQLKSSILREVSACPGTPKQFRLAKLLLEALPLCCNTIEL